MKNGYTVYKFRGNLRISPSLPRVICRCGACVILGWSLHERGRDGPRDGGNVISICQHGARSERGSRASEGPLDSLHLGVELLATSPVEDEVVFAENHLEARDLLQSSGRFNDGKTIGRESDVNEGSHGRPPDTEEGLHAVNAHIYVSRARLVQGLSKSTGAPPMITTAKSHKHVAH